MRKRCDLCRRGARMYCESDQANLCWDCDAAVHGANFLVAKHTRRLLCAACESLTPWAASGARLGPTVSVCGSCSSLHSDPQRHQRPETNCRADCEYGISDDDDAESYDDDDDDGNGETDLEDYGDEEDEDAENQVVPWTGVSPSPPPPPKSMACSSSSRASTDQIFSRDRGSVLKRTRENSDSLCSGV